MLQNIFFNLTILSLSLSLPSNFWQLHYHNSFFPPLPFSTIPLPQINFSLFFFFFNFGNLASIIPFFFPPIFGPNFCNLVATILFFFSNFRQLGCHNSFFLSPLSSPTISATWLPQLLFSFQALLFLGHFIWVARFG